MHLTAIWEDERTAHPDAQCAPVPLREGWYLYETADAGDRWAYPAGGPYETRDDALRDMDRVRAEGAKCSNC